MRTKPAPHVRQRQQAERRQRQIDPSGGGGPEFKPTPKRITINGRSWPSRCPMCEWPLGEFERATRLGVNVDALTCSECKRRKPVFVWDDERKEMVEAK